MIEWPVYILLVPKVGRKFMVAAPNEEQAMMTAAWHAAIVIGMRAKKP